MRRFINKISLLKPVIKIIKSKNSLKTCIIKKVESQWTKNYKINGYD